MSNRTTTANLPRSPRIPWRVLTIVGVLAGVAVAGWLWFGPPTQPKLPSAITPKDYQRAVEAFTLKYGRAPDRLDTLSWLAEWYLLRHKPIEAIACFHEIPTSHPQYGPMARYQQGRTLLSLHRASEAEQQLRKLIAAEEASPTIESRYLIDARQRLRHILEVELRFEERHRLLRDVIDRGEDDAFEAVAGCFPSMLRWNGPDGIAWHSQFLKADPASPWVRIAHGRYLTGQGKSQEAIPILQDAVREFPENRWATAALIACLNEAGDVDAAERMIEALPPPSDDDPWMLQLQRGRFALQKGDPKEASRAFQQVLTQDHTSTEAWQGMYQAAQLTKDEPVKIEAQKMITAFGRIQNHLGKTTQDAANPESYLDVADLCDEFNLTREGAVMARAARRIAPDNDRVQTTVNLFKKRLAAEHQPPLLGN